MISILDRVYFIFFYLFHFYKHENGYTVEIYGHISVITEFPMTKTQTIHSMIVHPFICGREFGKIVIHFIRKNCFEVDCGRISYSQSIHQTF